jgi:hypothetical protein
MLSLPVVLDDPRSRSVYPAALASAFAYEPLGYVSEDTIINGMGYWLKFPASQSLSLIGIPLTAETLSVNRGWNMIGSITETIPIQKIACIPAGMTMSSFFSYHNSRYEIVDSITSGRAYWVKVDQPGYLILSSVGESPAASHITIVGTSDRPPIPPAGTSTENILPEQYSLDHAFPNPFNPVTTIRYELPLASRVSIKIYDLLGQVVDVLKEDIEEGGYRSVQWNATRFSSGVYFYHFEAISLIDPAHSFKQVYKMLLIK